MLSISITFLIITVFFYRRDNPKFSIKDSFITACFGGAAIIFCSAIVIAFIYWLGEGISFILKYL